MSSPVDASGSAQTPTSSAIPNSSSVTSGSLTGPPKPRSGVRVALEYTGIPPSWFEKRPRLPSRNWLIFWGVVTTATGYYIYDRRECKRIRQEYVDRVSPLAQVPLHSLDLPRKVIVYGAKWPGDEDHERNIKHFRKYVKPILHAAAIDYDMISGKRTGDIADRIADEIRSKRRVMAGIDPAPVSPIPLAANRTLEERRQRELAGGIVLVGRGTMKEFFSGLSRGWTEGLRKVDKEAGLAHILEEDGTFDEPDEPLLSSDLDGEPIPTPSKFSAGANAPIFSPLQAQMRAMEPKQASPVAKPQEPTLPAGIDAPPASIPALPPLLLVENTNRIGLSQIPMMIWDWFNERHRVQAGSEAAYRLVRNVTRPFTAPSPAEMDAYRQKIAALSPEDDVPKPTLPDSDLEFDRVGEAAYKRSLNKWPEEVEEARKEYYKALPAKLETARALARRTREPTKDEQSNPPPTEMELRQERMKREQRWRADMAGWDMIKPDSEVAWDERFRDALRVFADPPEGTDKST